MDASHADNNAIEDALDCLVHIAASSNEGHIVILESGGVMTVAPALQVSCSQVCISRKLDMHWKLPSANWLILL